MGFSFKGFIYQVFIDPLIKGLRRQVASIILPGEKVIDVACGTGALSLTIAAHAGNRNFRQYMARGGMVRLATEA